MNCRMYSEAEFELLENSIREGMYLPAKLKNIFWTQKGHSVLRNHWLDRAEFRHRAEKLPGGISAEDGILFGAHLCVNVNARLCNEYNSLEYIEEAIENYDKQAAEKIEKEKGKRAREQEEGFTS